MQKFTFRAAVENFKHPPLDKSGYVIDENTWSEKNIVLNLLEGRATEIKTLLERGIDVSDFMVQTLRHVELIETDRNETPCTVPSGCYWLRSKVAIPKFIQMISVTGIVASGINPRFTFIKWDRFQYVTESRIPGVQKGNYWTVREVPGEGYYLYLYGTRFLKAVAVSALWENPMEVEAFPFCGEVNLKAKCFPLDVDFYTDPWIRDIIMSKMWQKLLPVRDAAPDDQTNDDKHQQSGLK